MSTAASASRLRARRPAPNTSTTASAISATTNALRAQAPRAPIDVPLPPCRRPSTSWTRDTCSAGARPKMRLATSATISAKTKTRPSTRMSSTRGRSAGARAASALTPSCARAMPQIAEAAASTTLSVRSCLMSRDRAAPTAARTTISRSRTVARASRRLATFAHAMTITRLTAASRMKSVCRVPPTSSSWSDTTAADLPALVVGILRFELPRDRLHLGVRLRDRHVVFEPADHPVVVAAAGDPGGRRHRCAL